MQERNRRPTHKEFTITRNNIPLAVQALSTDREVAGLFRDLHGTGATSSLRLLRSTPDDTRKKVHGVANADYIIDAALFPGKSDEPPDIADVRAVADEAILFSAQNPDGTPLREDQQDILDTLNAHAAIKERRTRRAKINLRHDRPKKVRKRFGVLGGAAVIATIAAEVAEKSPNHFVQTAGFVLTQITDDAGNAAAIPATERGGEKSIKQIIKDSKALSIILPIVIGLDYYVIPQLIESPSFGVRIAGGVLFSAASVAGSLGANILHLFRSKSLKDHLSDPFRKNIWLGSGVSFALGMGTAALNVLAGKEYSTAIQVVTGMMETIPAFLSVAFSKPVARVKEYIRDVRTIHKAGNPMQIFPEIESK